MSSPEAPSCLALVCRRPRLGQGKQRLAATLGQEKAYQISLQLFDIAHKLLLQWPKAKAICPSNPEDLPWAKELCATSAVTIAQQTGIPIQDWNLGDRLQQLDLDLRTHWGPAARIMQIGSDCPGLQITHLIQADAALDHHDVVLVASTDGGVVLMGCKTPWPPLHDLPWSTARLGSALQQLCQSQGRTVAWLDFGLRDVDDASDLNLWKSHV